MRLLRLRLSLRAKQDTVETWLADAVAAGARVLVGTRARRVLVERGAAVGVDAGPVQVRARAVVVACGAFHTPALLRRSGLTNGSIGRNLHFHPVTLPRGRVRRRRSVRGRARCRRGTRRSTRGSTGGYGIRYETAPIHPGFFGAGLQWAGARESLELARRYRHMAPIFALVRDRDGGEVVVGRDGEPSARYRLSRYDLRHMRAGFVGAARILEAAGAKRIVSTHANPVVWAPGPGRGVGWFLAQADARGWEPNRVLYASAHLMGTARMGGSPTGSACDPTGETWEVARLVVCDGSTFPTASGVNPMVTIAAVAHLNATCPRGAALSILGVDVGGTFTDAVLLADGELRTAKVPTAARQEESVVAAARAVGAVDVERFTHGTTIATNALLERKGARTAFVATAGFEHLLHLRRQKRAHLYRLCAAHPEPLVPLERCVGVRGRMGPQGELEPLDLDTLPELDADAVAVCLLFSFRDAEHEREVADGAPAAPAARPCGRVARGRAGVPRVRARFDHGRRRVPRAGHGALPARTRRAWRSRPGCPSRS